MTLFPELSQKTIEVALKKLTDEGKIAKIGAGKSTVYVDVKRMKQNKCSRKRLTKDIFVIE